MKHMYDKTGRYIGKAQYLNAKHYLEAEKRGFRFADPKDGVEPEKTYWNDGEVVDRPAMEIAPSASEIEVGETVTYTGVPDGADVVLDGVSKGEADASGKVELTFDDPGIYQLRFDSWPMMPAYFAVDVS